MTKTKDTLNAGLILTALSVSLIYPLSMSFFPQIIGLIGCGVLYFQKQPIVLPNNKFFICIGMIGALILLSGLWAYRPEESFTRALKVSGILISFIPLIVFFKSLSHESLQKIRQYILYPFLIVGLFLLIELSLNFPLLKLFMTGNLETWILNKHLGALFVLSPAVFFLHENKKSILFWVLVALLFGMFLTTASQSVQLAAIALIGAYIGFKIMPKLIVGLSFLGASLSILIVPFIATYCYHLFAKDIGDEGILRRASAAQRLEIWDFVSRKIMENPILGMGIDATRYIHFDTEKAYYHSNTVLHPHSISLQIWLELGAVGVAATMAIFLMIYTCMQKMTDDQKKYSYILFTGIFCILMASWSIWASWIIGLVMLITAFAQIDLKNGGRYRD